MLRVPPGLQLEWQLRGDVRPIADTAADVDGPALGLHAVGEADQARAARRVGPADAVVADRQQQPAVARCERNLDARRLPMLGRVSVSAGS